MQLSPSSLLIAGALFLCAPAFGQSSDSYYYYAPNTVYIPVLQNKKDGQIGAGYSWGPKNKAFEAMGVYSPVRHAALMVSFYASGSNSIKRDELGTKFNFSDASLGTYQIFDGGSISLFAGVGQGRLLNNYGNEKFSRFTIRRWFLQPTIAFIGKNYRGGMALRLSRLEYPAGESSYDINGIDLFAIQKIEKESPFFLPELGLSGSVAMQPFFVSMNINSVFPDAGNLKFSRFSLSLMLSYDLGTISGEK